MKKHILSTLCSLLLICPAAWANDIAHLQKQVDSLELNLEEYDGYYRMDLYSALAKKLKDQQGLDAELLRGRVYLNLASLNSDLGANAMNYMQYYKDVVEPLKAQAIASLNRVIEKSQDNKARLAQAYYYRAQYYYNLQRPEHTTAKAEFQRACDLGVQRGCEQAQYIEEDERRRAEAEKKRSQK